MPKRALCFFLAILCLLGGLLLRLYTVSEGSLSRAAGEQASVTLTLGSALGTIYDRHMTPLVNRTSELKTAVAPFPETLSLLSETFGEAFRPIRERLADGKPVVCTLPGEPPISAGTVTAPIPVRYGSVLAPHVIGYRGADGGGVTGAEYVFDERLTACRGQFRVTYTVDAFGTPIEGVTPTVTDTLHAASAGVVLTLDAELQAMAEEVARQHLQRGAIVITEPRSGDILAMVSVPDYQPDAVGEALESEGAPLLNRAMTNYNCGSVFKMVTAAAALEAGFTTEETAFCSGSTEVAGTVFHCHLLFGHGLLDMPTAFSKSCNPYFIGLGQKVGAERLYAMASALGFTRAVTVAEGWQTARAVLPSPTDLTAPAELANLSFGQGKLMATPVHMAQLVGAIVNDGQMVRPRLQLGTADADGHLTPAASVPPQTVFSASTAAALRSMMERSTEDGTGIRGKPFHGRAAVKTGTAETGWYEDGEEVVQHWYAGYYPAEDPRYVLVVLSENMEASGVRADPAFRQLCEELYYRSLIDGVS